MRVALEPSASTLLFAILFVLSLLSVVAVHSFLQRFELAISEKEEIRSTLVGERRCWAAQFFRANLNSTEQIFVFQRILVLIQRHASPSWCAVVNRSLSLLG